MPAVTRGKVEEKALFFLNAKSGSKNVFRQVSAKDDVVVIVLVHVMFRLKFFCHLKIIHDQQILAAMGLG